MLSLVAIPINTVSLLPTRACSHTNTSVYLHACDKLTHTHTHEQRVDLISGIMKTEHIKTMQAPPFLKADLRQQGWTAPCLAC